MPDGLVGRIPRAATRPVPARGPRRRCRLCDRRLGTGNINYVGQTTRSVHQRVCREHARATANEIEKSNVNDDSPHRPMYQYIASHFQNLPPGTEQRDAFRQVIEVIFLPTGHIENKDDLRSWEVFWQFFLRYRRFFWGWSQR